VTVVPSRAATDTEAARMDFMVMHVSRVNRLLVLKEEVGKPALTY
jgi:hypothetical protein